MEEFTMAKQWLLIGSLLVLLLVSLAITVTAETLPDLAVKGIYVNSEGTLVIDQINSGGAVNTLKGGTYIWIDGQLKWTYLWETLEASRQFFLQQNGASSIEPQIILPGVHTLKACIDVDNIVRESDENNNCFSVRVKDVGINRENSVQPTSVNVPVPPQRMNKHRLKDFIKEFSTEETNPINAPDEMYAAYATEGGAVVNTQLVDEANRPLDIAVRFARPTASSFVALICAKGEDVNKLDVQFKANNYVDTIHSDQTIAAGTCTRVQSSGYDAFGLKPENIRELKQFSVLADASNSYEERNERNNYFHLNMEAFRKDNEIKDKLENLRPEVKEKIKQRLETTDFDEKLYARVLAEKRGVRVSNGVQQQDSTASTPELYPDSSTTEGLTTEEFYPASEERCVDGQCETPRQSCVNVGIRLLGEDKTPLYCDLSGDLLKQKNTGEACMNSYECATNSCNSGACTDLVSELRETRSLLQRVSNWLEKLFG